MSTPRVVLVEFNELCPPLLERFMTEGSFPNFSRFYSQAQVFTTDAEEQGERLNPWVQWITAHTGESATEHGAETLSEGGKVIGRNVWDRLSAAGHAVWVCGSMNASYAAPINGHVLPDPWSTGIVAHPRGVFDDYLGFVRNAVQEHSNRDAGITVGAAIRFLRFMLAHGLSAGTVWAVASQLLSERFGDTRWRRASVMDRLQFDLFRWVYKIARPAFSTFFINSTAHYQHCYWRHWEPGVFKTRPAQEELGTYKNAIPFGYQSMDRLLGKFMKLADRNTVLILATGLSQQPYLKLEDAGGRHYYRLHGEHILVQKLGLDVPFSFEPVMAEQFYLRFGTEEDARGAANRLASLRVFDAGSLPTEGHRAFSFDLRGKSLLVQCNCTFAVSSTARISAAGSAASVSFYDAFYPLEALKSGQHHPDGALWIRLPDRPHLVHDEKVSLRTIAPTILDLFGVLPAGKLAALSLANRFPQNSASEPQGERLPA